MRTRIHLSPPDVGPEELAFAIAALESGWVAPVGPDLEAFEREVASFTGRQFGVGLASGTAALHLALLAVGVKSGDFVVCSSMTFVATANAIAYIGAIPVFVDSELMSGNMSVPLLIEALDELKAKNRRVGAVLPVDFLGKVANLSSISLICEERGIPLVVDSAESFGSTHRGNPAGSFGVVAIFSFNGNKLITTSGGGMAVTDDAKVAERIRYLATQARVPAVHYEHVELGYNYRLSNILASIGRAQLTRVGELIESRRRIRGLYAELLSSLEEVSLFGGDYSEDNCWLTSFLFEDDIPWSPKNLQRHLELDNIESRPLWKPMHLQPLYRECASFVDGTSERLFRLGLALPSGSTMTESEWKRIRSSLGVFFSNKRTR